MGKETVRNSVFLLISHPNNIQIKKTYIKSLFPITVKFHDILLRTKCFKTAPHTLIKISLHPTPLGLPCGAFLSAEAHIFSCEKLTDPTS